MREPRRAAAAAVGARAGAAERRRGVGAAGRRRHDRAVPRGGGRAHRGAVAEAPAPRVGARRRRAGARDLPRPAHDQGLVGVRRAQAHEPAGARRRGSGRPAARRRARGRSRGHRRAARRARRRCARILARRRRGATRPAGARIDVPIDARRWRGCARRSAAHRRARRDGAAPTPARRVGRREPPTTRQTLRVDFDKLDTLLNLVGELVLAQARGCTARSRSLGALAASSTALRAARRGTSRGEPAMLDDLDRFQRILRRARRRSRRRRRRARPRRRRAAPAGDEAAHAADRRASSPSTTAPCASWRTRSASARGSSSSAPTPSSTRCCSSSSTIRCCTSCATRRPRRRAARGAPRRRQARGRRDHARARATAATRSSSRCATTAPASIPAKLREKAREKPLATDEELAAMDDTAGARPHLPPRLLDGGAGHRRQRAAASAWTSCATTITRLSGSIELRSTPGPGHDLHAQAAAHARHRAGAAGARRRRGLRAAARRGASARSRCAPDGRCTASTIARCFFVGDEQVPLVWPADALELSDGGPPSISAARTSRRWCSSTPPARPTRSPSSGWSASARSC